MNQQGLIWVGENTFFLFHKKGLFYFVPPTALTGTDFSTVRSRRAAARTVFEGGQLPLDVLALPGSPGTVEPRPCSEKKSWGPLLLFFIPTVHPLCVPEGISQLWKNQTRSLT